MKICPVCGERYNTSWNTCIKDGALLRLDDQPVDPPRPVEPIPPDRGYFFELLNYLRLFLMVAAIPVSVFLVLDWFQAEYTIKKSFFASLFSYSGAMLVMIIVAVTILLGKYQKDSARKERRRFRRKRK